MRHSSIPFGGTADVARGSASGAMCAADSISASCRPMVSPYIFNVTVDDKCRRCQAGQRCTLLHRIGGQVPWDVGPCGRHLETRRPGYPEVIEDPWFQGVIRQIGLPLRRRGSRLAFETLPASFGIPARDLSREAREHEGHISESSRIYGDECICSPDNQSLSSCPHPMRMLQGRRRPGVRGQCRFRRRHRFSSRGRLRVRPQASDDVIRDIRTRQKGRVRDTGGSDQRSYRQRRGTP